MVHDRERVEANAEYQGDQPSTSVGQEGHYRGARCDSEIMPEVWRDGALEGDLRSLNDNVAALSLNSKRVGQGQGRS